MTLPAISDAPPYLAEAPSPHLRDMGVLGRRGGGGTGILLETVGTVTASHDRLPQ